MKKPRAPKVLGLAFASAADVMASHSRDWGAESRDAWLWGIIIGWDDESLAELEQKFAWNPESIQRLKRYRRAIERAGRPVARPIRKLPARGGRRGM